MINDDTRASWLKQLLYSCFLCALVLLFACNPDEEEKATSGAIRRRDLPSLVLQPADVPKAFTRFDEGEQALADVPPGAREDPARFGREGGWKARYSRQGSAKTTGPLVIESRVDLFRTEQGAEQDLSAYRAQFEQSMREFAGRSDLLAQPEVGDDAVAMTQVHGTGASAVRFFSIAWRQSIVTASVVVNGFHDKITIEDALALARGQEERIVRIAEQ